MSTEQSERSVDPELVEQTKQQIRGLVREVAQLSKGELGPVEFFDGALNRIVAALAAVGGAVWVLDDDGRLDLKYQINLQETGLGESEEHQAQHGQLLRRTLESGEGSLVAPRSGAAEKEQGGNPTDFLLVLGPINTDKNTQGVIEVFQRPGASPTVQRGYLRFLLQMCDLAGDYLKTRQLRNFTDRQSLWSQLERFTRVVHGSLDPVATAYTIANEGRRLIECDRVSVAIKKGRRCAIEAVSGQDTFDRRSNTVTMLGRLATAVAASGETVWYTGDTSMLAPQVEDALQNYVDEAHSKVVAVIPLLEGGNDTTDAATAEDPSDDPAKVLGALIVEQIEDARPKEGMERRVEVVSGHSACALTNAMEHHRLFLLPLWRALGRARWVLKARTLPKTIAVVLAVVGLGLWLTFWPADFTLEAKGAIEPAEQRDVFASLDGQVVDVLVEDKEMVKKGQLLVLLRSVELEERRISVGGELLQAEADMTRLERQLKSRDNQNWSEKKSLQGELKVKQEVAATLAKQIEILEQQQAKLNVTSPIDGQVEADLQLRDVLMTKPVSREQVLMTIADPTKEWVVKVNMPESRMGHIARARSGQDEPLEVTYILATSPGKPHKGTVEKIQGRALVRGDEGNTVQLRVAINRDDLSPEELRSGVTATAKVHCGKASVGYVWFHDLIAFVQTKILFRLW